MYIYNHVCCVSTILSNRIYLIEYIVGNEMVTGVWRGDYSFEHEDLPSEPVDVDSYVHSSEPGEVYVFFGCRNTHDYIFKDTLQKRFDDGTITQLDVAMSRTQVDKVYVTHKLLERKHEIAELILKKNAAIYICGDGNQMSKDVENVFKQGLLEYSIKSQENWLNIQDSTPSPTDGVGSGVNIESVRTLSPKLLGLGRNNGLDPNTNHKSLEAKPVTSTSSLYFPSILSNNSLSTMTTTNTGTGSPDFSQAQGPLADALNIPSSSSSSS